jgi:hypothetical protein
MRYLYLETNNRFDLDEDGVPCYEHEELCRPEFPELCPEQELPDEPVCPVLYQWVMEAKTAGEVCEMFQAHEIECPVCKPGMRRAA